MNDIERARAKRKAKSAVELVGDVGFSPDEERALRLWLEIPPEHVALMVEKNSELVGFFHEFAEWCAKVDSALRALGR